MRGWVICDSTFSIPTSKPTLSTAQRHGAVMYAIYSNSNTGTTMLTRELLNVTTYIFTPKNVTCLACLDICKRNILRIVAKFSQNSRKKHGLRQED